MTTLVTDAKFTNMQIVPKHLNALFVSGNMPPGVESILERSAVDNDWVVPQELIPVNYRRVTVNANLTTSASAFDSGTQHPGLDFGTEFYASNTYRLKLGGVYRLICTSSFSSTPSISNGNLVNDFSSINGNVFVNDVNDERGIEVTVSNVDANGQVLTIAPKYEYSGGRSITVGGAIFLIST